MFCCKIVVDEGNSYLHENTLLKRDDEHDKCPSRMIGKSTRQDVPGPAKRAERPLGKVNFYLIISIIKLGLPS